MNPRRQRARRRRRQEGAALLIVLFVLMMATTTAVYSLSSTQFEVRAAGALHQSMRAKFVSEAATTGVLSLCQQLGSTGCASGNFAPGNVSAALRQTYALPDWGAENVYAIDRSRFSQNAAYTAAAMLPDDATIAGAGGGMAGAWSPDFLAVLERWDIPQANNSVIARTVVSTYGALIYDSNHDFVTDDVKHADEQRDAHSTISATRAYIDIRNF
jgi:hypothetical protein